MVFKKFMVFCLIIALFVVSINPQQALAASKKYLGVFTIYAYCISGTTASGTTTTKNRTIAVDPKVIPLGSKVMIDGKTYIAEDTGGSIKGKKLDVYVSSREEALNWGVRKLKVYILE